MAKNTKIILKFVAALLVIITIMGCLSSENNNNLEQINQTQNQETQEKTLVELQSSPIQYFSYPIVDTGQTKCYDNTKQITCPKVGVAFYGQDAQYLGNKPAYKDNGDGTITDLNTGLIWQKDPGEKMTYNEAVSKADSFILAGYDDWRLPTIKELYSLILFSGVDPPVEMTSSSNLEPFIDTNYFVFEYGDTTAGERIIDSQFLSSNKYVSGTMPTRDETAFGVNFADGRIKGYGLILRGSEKEFYVIYVRGNPDYGKNDFVDNGDGTITDKATGLMWQKVDSSKSMSWEDALEYAENINLAGYSDWRLPNAKELQSIVDYTRSPTTTNSPAIDPIFKTSPIKDEEGNTNYPFYWTSTTHANSMGGSSAVYIAFGEALGWMKDPRGQYILSDVHGAGAQRSDPKSGNPANYPYGHGPQGDVIRIYNYVRCVRDDNATIT